MPVPKRFGFTPPPRQGVAPLPAEGITANCFGRHEPKPRQVIPSGNRGDGAVDDDDSGDVFDDGAELGL